MFQILSKMFEFFQNKNKRLQNKIDKYIELEKQRQILKSQVDECADDFVDRKSSLDELMKSESDQSIKDSVQERYDNYVSSYIVEIGDLKRRRDKIDSDMNNLIKGDGEFIELVEKEKETRKFKSILFKYRNNDIELSICDSLIKAVSKKKVDYADNLVFNEKGQLLLLKRSEVVDFKSGHYTIPGGHVDPGEDFETAAKRELLEEAGIKSEDVIEIGKYENEEVCIHYFRSDVVNIEPLLQEEEIWSYEWVDPKELDKYLMMDNMRDNIVKILFPVKHQIITIKKSFESGVINEDQRNLLLDNILEKAKSGIYKMTSENKKLGRVGQKYGSKKEVNKYQKIKDYAEKVIRGEKHIERLSSKEEQGRLLGGRANVEASLLIGRYAISDKSEIDEISKKVDLQEKELEDYAKENNLWIDQKEIEKWERLGGGEEASVYPSKTGYVKKIYDYKLFSFSPLEFIDNRISLHNFLFKETAYELIGFTKNKDRGFQFVVEQPYIDLSENTPVKNVKEEMEKRGFKDMDGNSYYNDNYIIDDLHHKNVLTSKSGKLYFIDTVPYLNEEGEGYGGKRKYNSIKFEKSEEQDIEKAESFKDKKTEDDIPVDKFFEHKFEDKYKIFYEAVKKYLYDKWEVKSKKEFDDKFSKESKLKEVDIDDIIPTQRYVSKKIMDEKMKNDHFKSSKIQLLKFDSNYYLYDGHHRTSVMIEEGYDTVKEEVLKLNKIKDFEKDIEKYLPEDYDLYDIVDKAEENNIEKACKYYKNFEKIKEKVLKEKRKEHLEESDFLDMWKLFMTSKNSEGIEEFNEYTNRYKLYDLPYWPNGLDLENCETVYLDKTKVVVIAGGDWQEGKYVTIGLSRNSSGDGMRLEVIAVSDKKEYKQSSRERMKFRKENGLVKSEYDNLNKAFDEGYIDETQYNSLLEKAWKKQPIGTVTTRKDGKKYRKVSETGNMDQDWKLVSKDKTGTAKPESERNSEAKQQEGIDNKPSNEELQESAKNTSETALTNAVKQSPDPEVRQTAHEELKRREEEEKPKEEGKEIKEEDRNKGTKSDDEVQWELAQKQDEQIRDLLDKYDIKIEGSISTSTTDYGISHYFYVKDGDSKDRIKVRISDHEATNEYRQQNEYMLNGVNEENIKRLELLTNPERFELKEIKGRKPQKGDVMRGGKFYEKVKKDTQKSEESDIEKAKDQIKGGLADKLSIEQIADKHGVSVKSIKKQIKKGIKVEMEHTDDPKKAKEISKDHLTEDPKYYTRLAKMEDEAKKENKED